MPKKTKFKNLVPGDNDYQSLLADLKSIINKGQYKAYKELGGDFFISGRQVPIKIDRQTHFIDMILYHRGIPCVVLVDLKIGKLDSVDIGQMNK